MIKIFAIITMQKTYGPTTVNETAWRVINYDAPPTRQQVLELMQKEVGPDVQGGVTVFFSAERNEL